MKRVLLLLLTASFMICIYAQKKDIPTDVLKNRIDTGGIFRYSNFSSVEADDITELILPYGTYTFESTQKDRNKFYLNCDSGYDIENSSFFLNLDPQMKFCAEKINSGKKKLRLYDGGSEKEEEDENEWQEPEFDKNETAIKYDPDEDIKRKYYFTVGLPLSWMSADAANHTYSSADITARAGYERKTTDIKKLSPWAQFERGFSSSAILEYRLSESSDDSSPDDLPVYAGLKADYSFGFEGLVKNSFLKTYTGLKYQLKEDGATLITEKQGYRTGNFMIISLGTEFAHDISRKINLLSSLGCSSVLLDDVDNNSINSMNFSITINYYPVQKLNTFAGYDLQAQLTEKDTDTVHRFIFGVLFRFDFIER